MQSTSPTGLTDRTRRLPPVKRLIKLIGRATFWWMSHTAWLLRPWSVRVLGNLLGSAFYGVSARYRNVTLRNLRAAYGREKSEAEIKAMAKEVFRHFTREAFQFFYLLSLSSEQVDALVDTEGYENIDAVLARGSGCVVATAHFGNWELMARKSAILGYRINVIVRDSDDPGMTGITTRIRESGGYRVFDRDQPIIGAFRRLKNNEVLGILLDQHEVGGVLVDFFGRPAATATGVAVLSLRSGASIVPVFAHRMDDGRYKAIAYPAIEFEPTGDWEEDVVRLTQLCTRAIEQEVRLYPTQWLWLHNRWKSAPEARKLGS